MTPGGVEWAAVTSGLKAPEAIADLRELVGKYLTEADLWSKSTLMYQALVDTARRLSNVADDHADDRDPETVAEVAGFAYAGRLQLEHVQSTRRFAWGEPPHVIPRTVRGRRV
jgi:ABC-type arginine transport system ATPase subunit